MENPDDDIVIGAYNERLKCTYDTEGRTTKIIVLNDDDSINRTLHYSYYADGNTELITLEDAQGTSYTRYNRDEYGFAVEVVTTAESGQLLTRLIFEYITDGMSRKSKSYSGMVQIVSRYNSDNVLEAKEMITHDDHGEVVKREDIMAKNDASRSLT